MLKTRQACAQDAQDIFEYSSVDPAVWWPRPNSLEETSFWLENFINNNKVSAVLNEEGKVIGLLNVNNKTGLVGFFVSETYRGKGSNVAEIVIDFLDKQEIKVVATPRPANTRCHRFLEKCGFIKNENGWERIGPKCKI